MKHSFLIAACLVLTIPLPILALDTVTLRNGKVVKCQVTEYGGGVVKLRLPTGTVRKGRISVLLGFL